MAVTFLASYALVVHRACMEAAVGQGFTHWTVVPSLKQPVAALHPLRGMVATAAPGLELGVTRAAAVVNPRDVTPENFVIPDVDLAGAHVLIIDDTWTTGGHAMSLAVALKQTGAARVSVVVGKMARPQGRAHQELHLDSPHDRLRTRPLPAHWCQLPALRWPRAS